MRAYHSRLDKHAGKLTPSLAGKQVQSAFVGTILFRRYTDCMELMPNFVGIQSVVALGAWAKTITAAGCIEPFTPPGGGWGAPWNCSIKDPAMLAEIETAVKQIDWQDAAWDVYAAVPFVSSVPLPSLVCFGITV